MLIKKNTRHLPGDAVARLIKQLHKKKVPALIQARGSSMAPFIRNGDLMTISPKTISPGVGDIVAFLKPRSNEFVVHRIVAQSGIFLIIKGDNISGRTDTIKESDIIGIVTCIHSENGKYRKIGIGPGKKTIAFFSRLKMLPRLVFLFKNLIRRKKLSSEE